MLKAMGLLPAARISSLLFPPLETLILMPTAVLHLSQLQYIIRQPGQSLFFVLLLFFMVFSCRERQSVTKLSRESRVDHKAKPARHCPEHTC